MNHGAGAKGESARVVLVELVGAAERHLNGRHCEGQ